MALDPDKWYLVVWRRGKEDKKLMALCSGNKQLLVDLALVVGKKYKEGEFQHEIISGAKYDIKNHGRIR